mmetsp:Transcript_39123/g.100196  ORF Transcript_39123/g.100196 Transcript_39123/m.100196 type:complete len:111 (-) Transcript_39123:1091-1423(-)
MKWDRLASLCPIIHRAADEGDETAIRIIQENAQSLVSSVGRHIFSPLIPSHTRRVQIRAVVSSLGFDKEESFSLVLAGGVFKESQLKESFEAALTKAVPNAVCIHPTVSD